MDKNSSSPAPSFWVVYNLSAWFHRLADFPPGGILCDCEYVKPAPTGLGCGERTVSPHLKPGQGRRETLLLSWPGQSLGPAQCKGEWGRIIEFRAGLVRGKQQKRKVSIGGGWGNTPISLFLLFKVLPGLNWLKGGVSES